MTSGFTRMAAPYGVRPFAYLGELLLGRIDFSLDAVEE